MGNDGGGVVWTRDSSYARGRRFADYFVDTTDGEIAGVARGSGEAAGLVDGIGQKGAQWATAICTDTAYREGGDLCGAVAGKIGLSFAVDGAGGGGAAGA